MSLKIDTIKNVSDYLEYMYLILAGDFPEFRKAAWIDKVAICKSANPDAIASIAPPGIPAVAYAQSILEQEATFVQMRLALDSTFGSLEAAINAASDEQLLEVVGTVVFPGLLQLTTQVGGEHKAAFFEELNSYQEMMQEIANPSEPEVYTPPEEPEAVINTELEELNVDLVLNPVEKQVQAEVDATAESEAQPEPES